MGDVASLLHARRDAIASCFSDYSCKHRDPSLPFVSTLTQRMLAHSVARHDVQYGEAVPTFQLRRRRAPQASPVTSRRERHSYRPVTCKASGGGSGGDDDVRYGLNLLQWAGKIVPQGAVVTGVKAGWRATWQAMVTELAPQRADGSYARPQSTVRSALLRGARFEPGQLVLFVGNACPWCHRATLVLALRGISSAVRVVKLRDDAERASRGGWVFDPSAPDPLFGKRDLREVRISGRGDLLEVLGLLRALPR